MRRSLVATGLCVVFLTATSQPGIAADRGVDIRNAAASDLSAAKKKKQQYVYVRRAPQTGYVRGPWADPSFGADGRPYPNPYPPNECSTDLGYGRFSGCNHRN
jgi:hypothetical protein